MNGLLTPNYSTDQRYELGMTGSSSEPRRAPEVALIDFKNEIPVEILTYNLSPESAVNWVVTLAENGIHLRVEEAHRPDDGEYPSTVLFRARGTRWTPVSYSRVL